MEDACGAGPSGYPGRGVGRGHRRLREARVPGNTRRRTRRRSDPQRPRPVRRWRLLELVAFIDPADEQDNVWGWRPFLQTGGCLIDYCATSGDLAADVQRLTEAGLAWMGRTEAGGGFLTV